MMYCSSGNLYIWSSAIDFLFTPFTGHLLDDAQFTKLERDLEEGGIVIRVRVFTMGLPPSVLRMWGLLIHLRCGVLGSRGGGQGQL